MEDQGPMKLYNLATQQIEGMVEMWDTKFQPFVVRAGGSWGEKKPCLDAEIRRARIEFWPFVSAALLLLSSGIFVGGFNIFTNIFCLILILTLTKRLLC